MNDIRKMRRDLELSQADVARAARISQMTVSKAERGKPVGSLTIRRIVVALLEARRTRG
jgi:predicted transcriptional regulator